MVFSGPEIPRTPTIDVGGWCFLRGVVAERQTGSALGLAVGPLRKNASLRRAVFLFVLVLLGLGCVLQVGAQEQTIGFRTIDFAGPTREWQSGPLVQTQIPFGNDNQKSKDNSRFPSGMTTKGATTTTTTAFTTAVTARTTAKVDLFGMPGEFATVWVKAGAGDSSSLRAIGEMDFRAGLDRRTYRDIVPVYDHPVRPFAEWGMALKLTALGPGVDLATTLLRGFNLRAGVNFVDFGATVVDKGVNYFGDIHLRSGQVNLDWFPFHGGFHISPGVLIFDHRIQGGIFVPGGQMYTLEDETFESSATDPITGLASLKYEKKVAPSLTIGFANIIPRSGKRWTVPVELGVAYTGRSSVDIVLRGTACQPGGCFDVSTDPGSQQNLQEQLNDINDDLRRVRVYPLLSVGVGYRF